MKIFIINILVHFFYSCMFCLLLLLLLVLCCFVLIWMRQIWLWCGIRVYAQSDDRVGSDKERERKKIYRYNSIMNRMIRLIFVFIFFVIHFILIINNCCLDVWYIKMSIYVYEGTNIKYVYTIEYRVWVQVFW